VTEPQAIVQSEIRIVQKRSIVNVRLALLPIPGTRVLSLTALHFFDWVRKPLGMNLAKFWFCVRGWS
jgi:hypothetical protein